MKYSIVIPTYNHCDDLLRPCLESIVRFTDLSDAEVLVVANGCTDGTKEYVESLGEPFKLIWVEEQLGFTKATNLGFKQAIGDYVVLLNNDTMLLEQKGNAWLEMLQKPFLDDSSTGLTGVLELRCQYTEEKFFVFFCTMITQEVFATVGYLDEVFSPGGGEDIDFCIRTRKAGFKTVVADTCKHYPGSEGQPVFPIYHVAEGTFKDYPEWKLIFDRNSKLLRDRKASGYYGGQKLMKLNLGCGNWKLPGYVNCDLYDPAADEKWDARAIPLPDNSADEIYTSHVFEHFDYKEAFTVLEEWKRVLKPGGTVIIETPNFYTSCKEFVKLYEEGNWGQVNQIYGHFFSEPYVSIGQVHKFMYTPEQMMWTLQTMGYVNIRQEPALRFIGREHICMKFLAEKP